MYSYEDRIRAVELYIKLGKRVQATIRQLGYPTENALKAWYREYEKRCDLPIGFRRKPKYSPEQKVAAVDHYINHGRCIAATSKALGYPYRMLLRDWIHELHPELCKRAVGGVAADVAARDERLNEVTAHCASLLRVLDVARGGRDAGAVAQREHGGPCYENVLLHGYPPSSGGWLGMAARRVNR